MFFLNTFNNISIKSLEFELPLFSLIFLIILIVSYYSKERLNIVENKYYNRILIFSTIEVSLSTVVHIICSVNDFDVVCSMYFGFIDFVNKIITTSFVGIFTCFLAYILLIGYPSIREKSKKIDLYSTLFIVLFFIVTLFTHVELVSLANVTNVKGGTPFTCYVVLAILLTVSFLISLTHIKSIDKRFFAIFVIVPVMIVGYLITLAFPNIIIYDVIITVFCYIMFFTMENPDIKMLDEIHKSKKISDSANEEKAMFLYNMTQEIRGITSKIDNYADAILESKDWDETYNNARDIKAVTSKFTNITNDILDVSNIDSDNIKVYNDKYNVKTIMRQLISIYTDKCKSKELKFITNIDHDIPEELYGDSIGLKEVLNAILDNAFKYTDKGYIEFSVNAVVKNDICRLIITIEDSGVGIKSENINKIKVDNKSLAKANSLITSMNGTMIISSDFGVGTKVKVILDQKIEVTTDTEVSKYDSVFDDTNILCVDDSEAGLKIIDKLLKGTKIRIDKAETGKECLDMIRVNKYDIILLDEELSQVSGIELIGKIKEIRNFNTPVILLTKDNNYEYNDEYLNVGFSDYILKPIKKNELIDKINKYTKKGN